MTMYWLSKNVLLDRYSCWIWERKETNRKRWNMKKFEDLLTQHARDRFQAQKRPNASNITLTSLYLYISHLSLSFDWCDTILSLWFDSFSPSLAHSLPLSLTLSHTAPTVTWDIFQFSVFLLKCSEKLFFDDISWRKHHFSMIISSLETLKQGLQGNYNKYKEFHY